jgi:hypothetical protein
MDSDPEVEFTRLMLRDCRQLVDASRLIDPDHAQRERAVARRLYDRSPVQSLAAMACVASGSSPTRSSSKPATRRAFPHARLAAALPAGTDQALARSCSDLIEADANHAILDTPSLQRLIESHGVEALVVLTLMAIELTKARGDEAAEAP